MVGGIFAQQVSQNGNLGEVIETSVSNKKRDVFTKDYQLFQCYPNPFNAIVLIRYKIPHINVVKLKIFDLSGNEVITLMNKRQHAGEYVVEWNGKDNEGGDVASGIYFYQLRANSFVKTKKALFIK